MTPNVDPYRMVPKAVPYDNLLNDLGWEMNEFLTENEAKFDGRVFNNMKGFLKRTIEKWVNSVPVDSAILNALSEATSRAEKLERDLGATNSALFICGYGGDTHAGMLAALEALKKMSRENRARATKAEAERDAAVEALLEARKIVAAASTLTETDHIGDVWQLPLAVAAKQRIPMIDTVLNARSITAKEPT